MVRVLPFACVLVLLSPMAWADAAPDADVWEPPLVPGGIALYGCVSQYGSVPFPRLLAQSLVPEGFTANRWPVTGNTQLAPLALFVQRCSRAELPDGSVHEDYVEAWQMIPVTPPAGYPTAKFNVFVTGYLTNIPAAAVVFESWGLTTDADGTIATATAGGVLTPGASTTFATGSTFAVEAVYGGSGLTFTAQFPFLMRAYTKDADGIARRGMDLLIGESPAAQGTTTLSFAYGAPGVNAWGGSGLGSLYEWAPQQRTQTMVAASYL